MAESCLAICWRLTADNTQQYYQAIFYHFNQSKVSLSIGDEHFPLQFLLPRLYGDIKIWISCFRIIFTYSLCSLGAVMAMFPPI